MSKRAGLQLLVIFCLALSRPGVATSQEATPSDAGMRDKERRTSDRRPKDPAEPDNFEFIIPPGRETQVSSLFGGLAEALPAGVSLGDIAIERDLARLAVVIDGRAAALVAAHPQRTKQLPKEVFRQTGTDEGLLLIGVCNRCRPQQVETLRTLASVVAENQEARLADIWTTKPPAPPPTMAPSRSAEEGSHSSGIPWRLLLRVGGALTIIVGLFLLLPSRKGASDHPPPSDDSPDGPPSA